MLRITPRIRARSEPSREIFATPLLERAHSSAIASCRTSKLPGNFDVRQLAIADECARSNNGVAKISREGSLLARIRGVILSIFEVGQNQAEIAINGKDGLRCFESNARIIGINTQPSP